MGAYQPQCTWARKQSGPRGQTYGYRMSMWAEHMETLDVTVSRNHIVQNV
ncbi:hypothetical protein N665_0188s0267 [Sinapis alba]|nr:hypothetical protein N665_0188s0267 [Sinapis alba]